MYRNQQEQESSAVLPS